MSNVSDLEIVKEDLGSRQIRLTVDVGEERVQQEMRKVARRIAREVSIPGFRKGKAPYDVIVQRYGEQTIRQEAAESLLDPIYREALEREEVVPYASGDVETLDVDPLHLVFVVPLPPVVDLGDYRSLRAKFPKIRVKKEEVSQVLDRLREEHIVLEPVEDRGAMAGDGLRIVVQGRAEDGTSVLDEEGDLVLDPESTRPAIGFHAALVGMLPGEERNFRLEMPDGQPSGEVEFTVRLENLYERTLPSLDDDLARTIGEFDSLRALESRVKEQVRESKRAEAEAKYSDEVVKALIVQAEIKYPPVALEEELDEVMGLFARRVQSNLRMSLEDYVKAAGKTEDELRSELLPQAEERLERGLVLAKLVEAERLTVDDEEVEQRAGRLSQTLGIKAEDAQKQLLSGEGRRAVVNDLLTEKVLRRLTAIARGEAEETDLESEEDLEG